MIPRHSVPRASLTVIAGLFTLASATAPAAAVEYVSRFRDVLSFSSISTAGGEGAFDSDQIRSFESGAFNEEVDTEVFLGNAHATGHASQSSTLSPESIVAFAGFVAEASTAGDAEFAEALGSTRLSCRFVVDTETPMRITGLLSAYGNGVANLSLIHTGVAVLVYHSIRDQLFEVDEEFLLVAGSYELTLTTSGYGQALPEGEVPAGGAFEILIDFGAPTDVADDPADAASPDAAVRVVPNPTWGTAEIRFAPADAGAAAASRIGVAIFDARGRRVRSLAPSSAGSVLWDTADAYGRPVPAGVYFVHVAGRPSSTPLVVLRR